MQDTNSFLTAITKYLIEERINNVTLNSDSCFVVSCSANMKYWLLLCEKTVHLFILETQEDILLDSIQPAGSKDETLVEYWMNLPRCISLITNVVWNEDEMICTFTEFYTSPSVDRGNLITVDFSDRPVRIEKRPSIIKRFKEEEQSFGNSSIPIDW